MKRLKLAQVFGFCLMLIGGFTLGCLIADVCIALGEASRALEPVLIVGAEQTVASEVEQDPWTSLGTFTVTAYCPCEVCCGKWSNPQEPRTATGTLATEGITVGADFNTIDPGTRIYIQGLGERIVEDKVAGWISEKYDGKVLDLYFDSHQEALDFGRKELEVWIIEGGTTNE